MGRKSTVPNEIKEELTQMIVQGKLTQLEICNIFKNRGFQISLRVVNTFSANLNKNVNFLFNTGISLHQAKNHKGDFEKLAWLLLKREIIGQTNQDNEKEIMAIKERIEFFTEKVEP